MPVDDWNDWSELIGQEDDNVIPFPLPPPTQVVPVAQLTKIQRLLNGIPDDIMRSFFKSILDPHIKTGIILVNVFAVFRRMLRNRRRRAAIGINTLLQILTVVNKILASTVEKTITVERAPLDLDDSEHGETDHGLNIDRFKRLEIY